MILPHPSSGNLLGKALGGTFFSRRPAKGRGRKGKDGTEDHAAGLPCLSLPPLPPLPLAAFTRPYRLPAAFPLPPPCLPPAFAGIWV